MASYEHILVERRGTVGVLQLNRPKMLNALAMDVFREIGRAIDDFEADDAVRAIIITGNERAFAAGADIKEMQPKGFIDMFKADFIAIGGDRVARCRKPTIAAVSGFALGGGCELAMQCDIIIAADNAKFGLPEIKLGVIPGIGGTQRLTRAVGKAKAMEMILSGRNMGAEEAERSGLVSRVVPAAELIEEAIKLAERIAHFSQPAVALAKSAVNRAFETTLAEGVRYERAVFYSTFATEDQKEGMRAFVDKRKPAWKHR